MQKTKHGYYFLKLQQDRLGFEDNSNWTNERNCWWVHTWTFCLDCLVTNTEPPWMQTPAGLSLKGIGDKCFAFQSKGIPPRRGPIVKLGRDVDLIEVNPANANATNSTVRVPDFLTSSRSSRTGYIYRDCASCFCFCFCFSAAARVAVVTFIGIAPSASASGSAPKTKHIHKGCNCMC